MSRPSLNHPIKRRGGPRQRPKKIPQANGVPPQKKTYSTADAASATTMIAMSSHFDLVCLAIACGHLRGCALAWACACELDNMVPIRCT